MQPLKSMQEFQRHQTRTMVLSGKILLLGALDSPSSNQTVNNNFPITVANAFEDVLRLLAEHHQAIQDLQRLVSALDTRLDRVEVPQ